MDASCDLSGDFPQSAPTDGQEPENAANGQESPALDAIAEIMGHFIDGYRQLKLNQLN